MERRYLLEQVDDAAVVQVYADGFDALPLEEKILIWHLYQAAGTRGRLLVDGAKEIKLLGRTYPVAAHVERIDSMSAHADYSETMRWLSGFTRAPRMTYLVHGDPAALAALSSRITAEKQWPVHIAQHLERVEIPA